MEIERLRPTVLQVTLHAYEMTALVAAARWALEGGEGELPSEARQHLEEVLAHYDAELQQLD